MRRRDFLRTVAVGAITSTALAGEKAIRAIDAHTHFYDPTRPEGVPWPGKDDKRLYRPVLPKEFLEVAGKHGVVETVVVEASPWLEDNQWLLDLAAREKCIVGVVGRLDPASEAFARHWERFAKDPLFRGIRLNHDELRKGLEKPLFMQNLRLLLKHDRTLDVNGGPDMPADVARLSQALPDLRVAINHAANLPIDGKRPPAGWLDGMRAAARGKNVFCKVSALVEGAQRQQLKVPTEPAFYRPVLDALWEIYGEDRLIYGSNWPVSENSAGYATVFGVVDGYFQGRSPTVREKFFRGNAKSAYQCIVR